MKILYMHANDLAIKAGVAGKKMSQRREAKERLRWKLQNILPELDKTNRLTQSGNALLALVCVEKGDERTWIAKVKEDILRARALVSAPEIVVGAFAHLSRDAAPAELAKRIMDDLVSIVRAAYPETKTFPFGWDKSLKLRVPLHHYNVAFRSFEPEGSLWDDIAEKYDEYMGESGHYCIQKEIIETLVKRGHARGTCLDVCCGGGIVAIHLSNLLEGSIVVGIDTSEKMLELAKRRALRQDSPSGAACPWMVHFMNWSGEKMEDMFGPGKYNPGGPGKLDTVLMFNAISYMEMCWAIIGARDSLKPSGRLIIAEEEPFHPHFFHTLDDYHREALEGIKHVDIGEMERMVAEYGLKLLDRVEEDIGLVGEKHNLVARVYGK